MSKRNSRFSTSHKYLVQLDFTFTVNTEHERDSLRRVNEGHCSCADAHCQLIGLEEPVLQQVLQW